MSATAVQAEGSSEPILSVQDLRVNLRTPDGMLAAVDGIGFEIGQGEVLGVVGESGSGKSVTALSIMRLLESRDHVTTGRIVFKGRDLLQSTEPELRQIRGDRISIVFQNPMTSLNPVMRVGDQLVEGIAAHGGASDSAARDRSVRLLREMGLTTPDLAMGRFPHQFSGGMRQRIMLAMGFGNSPDLLIADEPTTALDVTIQAQILDLLRELNAEFGTAIMLITHDLGVVASLCSRVAVMYRGRIVEIGAAELILAAPRHPYTQGLIAAIPRIDRPAHRSLPVSIAPGPIGTPAPTGCCFHDRCPYRMERCAEAPPPRVVAPGQTVACWLEDAPDAAGVSAQAREVMAKGPADAAQAVAVHPLLEVRGLTRHFAAGGAGWFRPRRRVHALDDVNLTVEPGETLGLVGESGSGKSTLARLMVRLLKPTAGKVLFEGHEISAMAEGELRRHRRHLQMVFQDPYSSLNPRLTVGSAVAEPLLLHGLAASVQVARRRAVDLLADVGLVDGAASRYPHEFSGGQRQRVGIARALATNPKLVVCDEPISALDVNIQAQILALLLRLQQEHRLTYVFISHNLAVVREIAHRIAVLYLGKIIEIADAASLFANPLHPYTRLLIAAVPVPDAVVERGRRCRRLSGEMPSVLAPPSGCRFRTRCPIAKPICAEAEPPLSPIGGRSVACHFPGEF